MGTRLLLLQSLMFLFLLHLLPLLLEPADPPLHLLLLQDTSWAPLDCPDDSMPPISERIVTRGARRDLIFGGAYQVSDQSAAGETKSVETMFALYNSAAAAAAHAQRAANAASASLAVAQAKAAESRRSSRDRRR